MTAPVRPAKSGGGGAGANSSANSLVLRLRDRAKEVMDGFSSGQKAVVVVAVLTVLIGGYMFMSWASKPSYVPLFSNLSSSDAAAITQKLSANKVPYELSEGGQQVLVPESDVYQQRLDMAAAGLPSSGDQGYSLLDSSGVTTSQFQQQVEYQQAVSDELEQTVESITGVTSAVVNVVIPQQTLFSSGSDQPSASVLVSLQAGVTLSPEQVQAVVHLVASSIEGLSPDNVTVVDSDGDVLNAPGSDSGSVAAGDIEQQQTADYEDSLDESLQAMLATVLGAGNAVVHTSAELDYDQSQTTSQIYDPNKQGPIPVQQASSRETYIGSGASQAAGVLGSGTPVTVAGSSTSYATGAKTKTTKTVTTTKKTTTTTKKSGTGSGATGTGAGGGTGASAGSSVTTVPSYTQVGSSQQDVVSQVTKTVNSAPGALERLSVAVVVDSSVKGVNANEVKQLVSAAAGLQPSRGDSIQVAFVPFNQSAAQQAAAQLKAAAGAKSQAAMISEARGGLVVLVVLGLLVYAMRRITKTTRVPLALPAGYAPLELEGGDDEDDENMALALTGARTASGPDALSPASPLQNEVSQIGQMIEREPERIAEMLREWLETGEK